MACHRITLNVGTIAARRQLSCLSVALGQRQFSSPPKDPKDDELKTVTHTGQVFSPDDYRNVRFTNASRYVNKSFAIDLIAEIPPKEVTERVVYCNGGDEHLGHPKVYINLDKPGAHSCNYCGLRFIRKVEHH